MELASKALAILQRIANDEHGITYVLSEKRTRPTDNADAWLLKVVTDGNHHLTFWMEGRNICHVTEVMDTDGRILIGDHNKMAVLGWMPMDAQLALERIVLAAHAHICPKE